MALIYEVRKQVLGFKEDKPTVYKVAAVRQQKVDFAKLVKEVSDSCGVHRTQSKAVVEALIEAAENGKDVLVLVELKGFEYCKLPTLARTLDISANQMREVIADFCETHEIRILELGPRMPMVRPRRGC